MASLSKLTPFDKADWYRGQLLMNQYPSYAEFLAYLSNPLFVPREDYNPNIHLRTHKTQPAQYVKTKAEQTKKVNEAWARKKKELQGVDEWWDNKVNRYWEPRVNLPWWNPYENREWTLKEIDAQPSDFIDGRFSRPRSETRIRHVPHKTTGQPTKKSYLQVAYLNPITQNTEWFGYWDEYQGPRDHANYQGYGSRPELYLTDEDRDRMELMHPIMYVGGIEPEFYHDKTHPNYDNTRARYEKHLKYSLAGLTPAKLKEHEKRVKEAERHNWQIWSKKKYTGTEPPSDPLALLNVTKAVRYAQDFPQIKAFTVGARGKVKLQREVLTDPYATGTSQTVDNTSWKLWRSQVIINLHDFGSHLADLEALLKKSMITQTDSDNAEHIKAAKAKIRKEKANIKKRQDPASIAKEVAERMKNVQADVEADAARYIERSEEQIQRQKDWLAQKKTEMKEITAGDENAFRKIYDRRDRDEIRVW